MTPVNVRALRPGDRLARAVFSRDGAKLLPRGTLLTPSLCASLRGHEGAALFYAVVAPRAERAETDRAIVGEIIEDKPGRRLSTREADAIIAERSARWHELPLRVERGAEPFVPDWSRGHAERSAPIAHARWPDREELARFRAERLATLRRLYESFATGDPPGVEPAESVASDLLGALRAFPERFTSLALEGERRLEYLAEHAFATGVLSAAIAGRMGLSERDTRLATLSGLLCDAGMATLPVALRIADKRLDEVELNRVRRHPTVSAALLARVGGVDERIIRAVHQHHERDDGAGYPTGARSRSICDLARIVAVADTFAAVTAFRPYRLATKRPHEAMAEVVRLAGAGRLDRVACRALLEAAGLFPVGSWVRLSTGHRALVIASNPETPDRPVVRRAMPGAIDAPPLDLAEFEPEMLRVLAAADEPDDHAATPEFAHAA